MIIKEVFMKKQEWIALNVTLPKNPSRVRVGVWRKLKQAGAVSIGQSMWILPFSDDHLNIFNDIGNYAEENKGKYSIMKTDFLKTEGDKEIDDYFNDERNKEYEEFLDKCGYFLYEINKETEKNNFSFAELEENEQELEKLEEWLNKIILRDFFESSLKNKSQETLLKCKEIFEVFANKIYELNDIIKEEE